MNNRSRNDDAGTAENSPDVSPSREALSLNTAQQVFMNRLVPLIIDSRAFGREFESIDCRMWEYHAAKFEIITYLADERTLGFNIFHRQERLISGKIASDHTMHDLNCAEGNWQNELIETLSEYISEELEFMRESLWLQCQDETWAGDEPRPEGQYTKV